MIKPFSASPRILAICALSVSIPLASPLSAQTADASEIKESAEAAPLSAAEEAAAAAAEAAEAVAEAAGDAVRPVTIRPSEAQIKRDKERKERQAAYEAAFEFTPTPALWKLSDADSTVFIFGSIKRFPSKLKWQSEGFTSALESADALYFEQPYLDRSDRTTRRQYEREAFRKLIRHDRDRIEKRFDVGLFDQIEGDLARDFIPIGDFMPTWLLVALIADTDKRFQPGRSNIYLDRRIVSAITERDITIGGLEEPSHVIDVLNAVREKKQRKWLNDFARAELMLDKSERYKARQRADNSRTGMLTKRDERAIAWASGRTPEAALTVPNGLSGLEKVIRDDRMKNWPVKIGAMLDNDGTSLVVVDQAYLYGENNLRSALEKKGYTLERVK